MDQSGADTECLQYNGASLIKIYDKYENDHLQTYLIVKNANDRVWLGMTCNESTVAASCNWSYDRGTAAEYNNFGNNYPNVTKGACVYMKKDDKKWYSSDCEQRRAVMCEVPQTSEDPCPYNYNHNCYFPSDVNASFADAVRSCSNMCADLVSIHSALENRYLITISDIQARWWLGGVETPPIASVEKSPDRVFKYCKIATFVLLGLLILGVVVFLILFFVVPKHGDQSASSTVVPSISTIGSTTVTKLATTTKPSKHSTTSKHLPTNGPITNTTASGLSTTSPSNRCSLITNTTFLFAYSNDLQSSLIQKALGDIKTFIVNPKITTFANNRFDTIKEDPIHFHGSKDNFTDSVNALLPDSKLKLPNIKDGSNVLNVIEKFLEQPTCGAIVYILMKRLPDTVDVTDLIQELRLNHISVFPVIDSAYIGSKDQSIMCKLAHTTNGFCDYQIASRLENEVYETMWIVSRVHVFVSRSYQVSGKGSIKVPSFVRPPQGNENGSMGLVVTYQNHARDTNFKALNLTITDDQNKVVLTGQTKSTNGNALLKHPVLKNNVTYQIDIDYEYARTDWFEKIDVRMYSISPPGTWIPFPAYQNVSAVRV
ncbi:hypothetical protein GCK72_021699 [Caenorhabditis remanei]|uniref:C-type lectin domain-containing protein n=1 Tax=Caenorhabditis remanei TaxID=31234 RepID=A0A6A5GIV3_CAERE|nr:hypothetical protein GCK72_021699 [Caenorhabditis remanei]KAF1755130.1 hypothetical protein GCK72_021699 [Caenorhabditis remanei]